MKVLANKIIILFMLISTINYAQNKEETHKLKIKNFNLKNNDFNYYNFKLQSKIDSNNNRNKIMPLVGANLDYHCVSIDERYTEEYVKDKYSQFFHFKIYEPNNSRAYLKLKNGELEEYYNYIFILAKTKEIQKKKDSIRKSWKDIPERNYYVEVMFNEEEIEMDLDVLWEYPMYKYMGFNNFRFIGAFIKSSDFNESIDIIESETANDVHTCTYSTPKYPIWIHIYEFKIEKLKWEWKYTGESVFVEKDEDIENYILSKYGTWYIEEFKKTNKIYID